MVEKARIDATLHEDRRFYPWMLGYLLGRVLPEELKANTNEVIVITDTIPVNRKRQAVEKSIRRAVRNQLPELKYRILHHQSRSHYGLQMADYCCWAIFRKWQKGESTWYDRIKPAMRGEFNVSRVGTEC